MSRAHQPGSEPIDIPETVPNPVVVSQANTYSDRTRSQGASSDPGEGSLARRPFRQVSLAQRINAILCPSLKNPECPKLCCCRNVADAAVRVGHVSAV